MFEINNLCKHYKNGNGISNITVTIEKPMITAFVGPNGSGKSTLFNAMAGLNKQDSGQVLVDKIPLEKLNDFEVSFMPDGSWLMPTFSVEQVLMYFSIMKYNCIKTEEIEQLILTFNMTEYRNKKVADLSKGMLQKLSIGCTLLGFPRIMIFDEPLNFLDTEGVIVFKKLLKMCVKKGRYVFLSSHILDFLDGLVEKVILIKNGEIVKILDEENIKNLEHTYQEVFLKG